MEIVTLQEGNSGASAYCLPTATGSIHSYFELADAIGPGHLVYGIQLADRVKTGRFKTFASLQEMAAALVPGFPANDRPVCLIGYSFGAALAIELAQQLVKLGKQVPLVVIIDRTPPYASFSLFLRVKYFIRNFGPWALRMATRAATNANYRSIYSGLLGQKLLDLMISNPPDYKGARYYEIVGPAWYEKLDKDLRDYIKSNLVNLRNYCFEGVYRGRILLFRSQEKEAHPIRFSRQLEDYGWGSITGASVDVVYTPGNHGSVVQQPDVMQVANTLRQALSNLHGINLQR